MRILVIDDEFTELNNLVRLLQPFGECDAATNGQQALALFCEALTSASAYRLVTIDINLPDASGITLLGRFRREEVAASSPPARKIMVTAASSESHVLAALTGDCDGFLVKPVRRSVLLQKLAGLGLIPSGLTHSAKS